MYKTFRSVIIALAAIALLPATALAWGTWGHNHINRGAVLALPAEMGMFFYNHTDFITEESTVPDLRKYTIKDAAEFPRHYIDLEVYGYPGKRPPATLDEAIRLLGRDTVMRYGILPWYVQEMMDKLTDAFRNKRKTEILFLAADLGHYVGDAHVPLHTTVNHNGQLTGQKGIHSYWESQLPELFGRDYNLNAGTATYIKDVAATFWQTLDSSYALNKPLLHYDLNMQKDNPDGKRYQAGPDGNPIKNKFGQPIHAYEYAHVYHELLDGMVERQLRSAIQLTASLWYTAWINAGKPDLSSLDPGYITERNMPAYRFDMKAWGRGKVKGCRSEKEFPELRPGKND